MNSHFVTSTWYLREKPRLIQKRALMSKLVGKMSILNYFQRVKKSRDQLPDPNGPLNTEGKVLSSAIASANIAIQAFLAESFEKPEHSTTDSSSCSKSRGPYLHLTPAQKFNIGKRASEHRVTNTLCYYKRTFPNLPLRETSVRRFKDSFQESLKRPRDDSLEDLCELPNKKMGRPLLIGEELDRQVQEYLENKVQLLIQRLPLQLLKVWLGM